MLQSNQPPYPEELSKFLTAQAAQLYAQPVEGVTPMPPEFQLTHPRRVRSSGWLPQPGGHRAHFIGYRILSPNDEAWFRQNDPENGLHDEDVKAFRESIRGPVKGRIVASFLAWFKFW
jgi:hypothetical protein